VRSVPKPLDVLLRAVASSVCPVELEHIRSLASTHHVARLAELERAIAERRRALSGAPSDT
jgi:hypothetical protein